MIFIGIGKNYIASNEEMPEKGLPTIFTKPESTMLADNANLQIPAVTSAVEYEIELAFRIGKKGKNVSEENAWDYIDAVTLAVDFTAKDVLAKSREKKGPWMLAKGFDGATPLSKFQPISQFPTPSHINFALDINGERVQTGDSRLMIYSLPEIVACISQFMTLNVGDVLLTGTPAIGKGLVKSGDHLQGTLEGDKLMDFKVL